MKRVNWFSGQQVQKEDLSYLQESLAGEISSRTASQYSKGVISPVSTYVGVDIDQTIVIHPFRAYTESGEQIVIPDDKRRLALDLTDDSNRQLGTQGFLEDDQFGWRSDTPYLIVAKYSEEAARPRPHYRTREPYATRIYGGFKFYAMREGVDSLEENGINPYIILAKAIFTDGKLFVTTTGVTEYAGLDATRVSTTVGTNVNGTYDLNSPISVDKHIRSIGDPESVSSKNPHGITAEILGLDANAVPGHEKLFHSNGFIGDPTDVLSCFYASIDARGIGVDYIGIRNLNTGDNLHYNGSTITNFIYPTDKIYISLSDDTGILPDGLYYVYADLETKEICVATNNPTVIADRTYNIIYNQQVQYTKHPTDINLLNTNTQYKLYTFNFSDTKQYTEIDLHGRGLNISNFLSMTDHRVFGSISASNLQRNHDGDLVVNFPIKTTSIKFSDGTLLDSANAYPSGYIDKTLRPFYVDGTTIKVGAGSCKDSTNKKLLTLRGDYTKNLFSDWNVGPNNKGGLAPSVEKRQGTYHIFIIGKENGDTDIAIDTDINALHCVAASTSVSSPIPDYRYYRRVGSVYVFGITLPDATTQLQLKSFITLPDSGNGFDTIYTENVGGIYIEGENTVFPIPVIFGGRDTIFSYMKMRLNVTNPNGASFKEFLPTSKTSAPIDDQGQYIPSGLFHTLSTGENTITTFNGKALFSAAGWQGYVISYYDPRII